MSVFAISRGASWYSSRKTQWQISRDSKEEPEKVVETLRFQEMYTFLSTFRGLQRDKLAEKQKPKEPLWAGGRVTLSPWSSQGLSQRGDHPCEHVYHDTKQLSWLETPLSQIFYHQKCKFFPPRIYMSGKFLSPKGLHGYLL